MVYETYIEFVDRNEQIGIAFISYAKEDQALVNSIIVQNFNSEGIPCFSYDESPGGEKFLERIIDTIDNSSCGVVILSKNSIKSKWVWFETGMLIAKKKQVIPFVIDQHCDEDFIRNLPDFIREIALINNVEELTKVVKMKIFEFGDIYDSPAVEKRVKKKAEKSKINFDHQHPKKIQKACCVRKT